MRTTRVLRRSNVAANNSERAAGRWPAKNRSGTGAPVVRISEKESEKYPRSTDVEFVRLAAGGARIPLKTTRKVAVGVKGRSARKGLS